MGILNRIFPFVMFIESVLATVFSVILANLCFMRYTTTLVNLWLFPYGLFVLGIFVFILATLVFYASLRDGL